MGGWVKHVVCMFLNLSSWQTELALLDSERPLETADDFERLVVSSPNSSSAWIHYMLHCLTAAEVDKARAVGQRALANIAYE